MIMCKLYRFIFVLSICFIGKLFSQTSNSGELIIKSNTLVSTVSAFDNHTTGDFVNDGTLIVYSNFNNDGVVGFTPATTTGLTDFKGNASTQTISGTVLSEFNNVRFENNFAQPAFLLSGNISVNGISYFIYGIVDNANYPGSFVFEGNASHQNTSDNSYVAGYVERNQNNQFEFPIGDGGFFRPLSISQTDLITNFFRSTYIFKNSNTLHPHNKKDPLIQIIDQAEYWQFESNQQSIDVAVTLSWNENTTPDEIINGAAGTELAIVRWDEAENIWKYYTTAVNTEEKSATASVTDDGIFTLARIISNSANEIVIHNGISPNDDGKNDYLEIDGITNYPNNTIQIYNRWGVKVFETDGYGINGNFFRGYSDGRATVKKANILPTGTYFYIISYEISTNIWHEKAGYIYIN